MCFHQDTRLNMKTLTSRFPILLIILILWDGKFHVSAMHTSFCIRFPKDKTLNGSYGAEMSSVGVDKFPHDIWEKYALSAFGDDGTGTKTQIDFIVEDDAGLKLDLYPIRGRPVGNDPLAGWFRVEVSIAVEEGFSDLIRSFVLFATDEQANFVGTFEYDAFHEDSQDCPPSDATKNMIIPCGSVSKYEPTVSNMILYVRNNSAKGPTWPQQYSNHWPIVPNFEDRYKLNFYYRYSIQALNKNKDSNIIIRLIADPDPSYTKDVLPNALIRYPTGLLSVTAYFIIRPGAIPGAADPLSSDRTSLSCSHATYTLTSGELSAKDGMGDAFYEKEYLEKHYQWFMKDFYSDQAIEALQPGGQSFWTGGAGSTPRLFGYSIYQKTGCSAKFFGGRCRSTLCSKMVEGSGINDPNTKRNKAEFDLIPIVRSTKTGTCTCRNVQTYMICFNEGPETPKLFNKNATTFYDCWDHYKDEVAGKRCRLSEDEAKSTIIKVIRRKPSSLTVIRINGSTITQINGSSKLAGNRYPIDKRGVRAYGFGTILYAVRKGHGVMMLIMSFFCVPISIFVSRYYKETFMSKRILYARVWFQMHIQLVFWMCTFFIAGLLLAFVGRGFLGVSLHPYGIMHRVFGWMTFVIFVIIASTGGIRMYEDPWRSRTIATHWALGYIFYIFTMLSVISSIHVPGSPIAQHDKSVDENNTKEAAGNYVYIVISFWILFELVMHVSMNFLLQSYDRWMKVDIPRKYLPPFVGVPIPVLKENSDSDASGNGVRLIAFWIYIGVSSLCALLCAGICVKNKPTLDRGFGPMSCTHEWNESLSDSQYRSIKYQMMKKIDPSCLYY